MTERKKRNIIIGSLCAVVLLMAVGYAAFQTVLNINGTSNISSNWNVKITDVTSKNIVGSASNNGNPTFTDTSATFKTNLVSPGDSLEYDITITNAGNLNAKLDKITLSDTNNPAIKFTSSGLTEGDIITAGSTSTLTVKVEYLSSVTSDPSSKTSSLTVTLDYSQATSTAPSGENAADTLIKTAVTSGDGLYADTYESGRYVYKGSNPANYITFNGENAGWRIISVEPDGTLKIMKQESIGNIAFDSSNSSAWNRPATLNTYLNSDYYNALSASSSNKVATHVFYVGGVVKFNEDLNNQIASEKLMTWSGKAGFISVSDYLKANTNTEQCNNYNLNNTNKDICKTTNYLHKGFSYWTISPIYADESGMLFAYSDGRIGTIRAYLNIDAIGDTYDSMHVLPAVYLKSDIVLNGLGTQANPYTIG